VGTFQSELFQQIMEGGSLPNGDYAIKAMWGDDRPHFLVNGQRHLWTVAPTDPYLGRKGQGFTRPINVILWSRPSIQDRLAFFTHGLGETDWRIPPWIDNDYRKQVTAWDRPAITSAGTELQRSSTPENPEISGFERSPKFIDVPKSQKSPVFRHVRTAPDLTKSAGG
jgi:hypothetical protein